MEKEAVLVAVVGSMDDSWDSGGGSDLEQVKSLAFATTRNSFSRFVRYCTLKWSLLEVWIIKTERRL